MAMRFARPSRVCPILLTVLLSLSLAGPFGAASTFAADSHAADGHAADPAPAHEMAPAAEQASHASADPGHSPWEHPLWANATTMMRIYLCDHARRPPSWCGAPQELPANAELPEPQGPPLIEEDARWLSFLDQTDPNNLSLEDVETIRLRATKRRDPQAMEILGFLYAEGVSVERNYAEAYRWYGLAFLAGEQRVRPNMDIVWQQLQRHDLEGALALSREFNALAAGEVPESLLPAVPAGVLPGAGDPAMAQNAADSAAAESDSPRQ